MRFVPASAAPRPASAARRAAPRRTRRAQPPRRAAQALTVRARGDDATSSSPPGDPNERLREELRRSLRGPEAELDGALSAGTSDRLNDDAEMPDETEMRSRGAPGGASRRYAITVREREIFRYTLPDFFPDFNETPLEARRNAGLDDDLSSSRESVTKKTKQPYVWRRGVLAGTERSDPLDVIARERERFERELANADDDDDDDERSESSSSRPPPDVSSPPERRAIPPPPRREGASNGAEEELGIVSKALVGLTLFFYLVALFATTSRAFLGDSQPAPIPSEGGALATRTPAPVPESIRGTRAGEMWQEKIAGTTDEGDVFV